MNMEIKNVTVFGAGKIGSQLAFMAAFNDYRVKIFDVSEAALATAREKLRDLATRYMQDHCAPEYKIDKALGNVSYSMTVSEAMDQADIAIEAIPGNTDIKTDFYRNLSGRAPDNAILITTSSVAVNELAAESGHPQRFMGLRLVGTALNRKKAELSMLEDTDVKVFYHVIAFIESIGCEVLPINVK
jgi:3-hydroxyacyl-CoA dehydrogenase